LSRQQQKNKFKIDIAYQQPQAQRVAQKICIFFLTNHNGYKESKKIAKTKYFDEFFITKTFSSTHIYPYTYCVFASIIFVMIWK
jgi:hypothetical protein